MTLLEKIYKTYELNKDTDIFVLQKGNRKIPILTKIGSQKILDKEEWRYQLKSVVATADYCAVKCEIYDRDGNLIAEDFGSAEAKNVTSPQKYFLEMATKRAKIRAVLIALGAHGEIYGEDESEDFKRNG